ncbi:UNVERIFIED_CONTAM: hypothetical protein FKN15_019723 [Acipenser sinensis]
MSEQNPCPPSAYVRWSDEETRVLISIIREEDVMRQLDRPKLRNSFVYQKVVDALSSQGIERTIPQTRDKFKKLKQSYLQERARRSRSGEGGRAQFRFWEEMDCLLGQRPVASVKARLIDTSQPSISAASCSSPNQEGSSTSTSLPALSQSAAGALPKFAAQHAEREEELCNPDAPSVELQEEDTEAGTSADGIACPPLYTHSGVAADRGHPKESHAVPKCEAQEEPTIEAVYTLEESFDQEWCASLKQVTELTCVKDEEVPRLECVPIKEEFIEQECVPIAEEVPTENNVCTLQENKKLESSLGDDCPPECELGFRDELASTIEHAVKAAVDTVLCKITKVVGGKFTEFQMEMAGKEKENESLKLRLEISESELKAVRECMNAADADIKQPLRNMNPDCNEQDFQRNENQGLFQVRTDQPHSKEVSEMEAAHISPELPIRWVVSADRTVEIKEEVTELGCDQANERILQEETPPSSITERGTGMKLVRLGRREESEMASSHIKEEASELEPVHIKEESPVLESAECEHLSGTDIKLVYLGRGQASEMSSSHIKEETPELEPVHIKEESPVPEPVHIKKEVTALEPMHIKEESPVLESAECEHLSEKKSDECDEASVIARKSQREDEGCVLCSRINTAVRADQPHSKEVSEMEAAHISPELPIRWVVSADRTVEIKEEVTELGCDQANERILQEETPPSSITERGE